MTTPLIAAEPIVGMPGEGHYAAALERQRPAMMALDSSEVRQINVDVPVAISRALGVLPTLELMRPTLVRDCPTANMAWIDQLEERAQALGAAHSNYVVASAPPPGLKAVVEETFESRTVLLTIVKGLIVCNLVKAESISTLNLGRGLHEAAQDTMSLIALFNNNWSRLEHRTPVTQEMLDHVQATAEQQLRLLGLRDQQPALISAASDIRSRAFTLLDRSYGELRRAVTFLRWREGDADTLVPPLRLRGPRVKDEGQPADSKADSDGTTTAPATSTTGTTPGPSVPVEADNNASGLPRTNPFTA